MSVPLPDRPDLDQLRRQAKELHAAVERREPDAVARVRRQLGGAPDLPVSLAVAQWVVARELGFPSWPKLKQAVEAARRPPLLAGFLAASIDGQSDQAVKLLQDDPTLRHSSMWGAAVLGDAEAVAARLRGDPAAALAVDDLRGWPPLMYLCYSHWHRFDPARTTGMVATAEILLDAGASPNTNNGRGPNRGYRSALHGSVSRRNPALATLLLDRGADPNDRVSLVAAADNGDHETLRALLDHGALSNWDWALDIASEAGDAEAVRLFLEAAARWSPERAREVAQANLGEAAKRNVAAVVATLLAFGADPDGAADEMPPFRRAVRAGADEASRVLVDAGAADVATPVDHLLGACYRADRAAADGVLAAHPGVLAELGDADVAAIVDVAARRDPASVALMLDLGFPPDARNDIGETAIHTAAYEGRAETVRLLLARGADPEARDGRFDATPLAFATVGSGEHPNPDGEWPETVRFLIDAGASTRDVWVADKPPSAEVAEVLRAYGVQPEQAPGDDLPEPSGALQELAETLRIAYDAVDLELFSRLLDPDVTWGGGPMGCHNRDEVIGWYRESVDRGARGAVTRVVQADEHTLIAEVNFWTPGEGTSALPPEVTYQRLEVLDGRITAITGHTSVAQARDFRPAPTGP
ncbi:MAG TPA: ankyrin repeat domain-containing protein [Acidimicrobiales bacterium]|jgi:ankyrin repeat protein|nr:ankyrin repeat domain-containing protein [Acidimicrobiales bacterium]